MRVRCTIVSNVPPLIFPSISPTSPSDRSAAAPRSAHDPREFVRPPQTGRKAARPPCRRPARRKARIDAAADESSVDNSHSCRSCGARTRSHADHHPVGAGAPPEACDRRTGSVIDPFLGQHLDSRARRDRDRGRARRRHDRCRRKPARLARAPQGTRRASDDRPGPIPGRRTAARRFHARSDDAARHLELVVVGGAGSPRR